MNCAKVLLALIHKAHSPLQAPYLTSCPSSHAASLGLQLTPARQPLRRGTALHSAATNRPVCSKVSFLATKNATRKVNQVTCHGPQEVKFSSGSMEVSPSIPQEVKYRQVQANGTGKSGFTRTGSGSCVTRTFGNTPTVGPTVNGAK